MKKFILIALMAILSSCTFTKQQKAEKLIEDYLKSTLNDPDSYESVNFSPLYKLRDTVIRERKGYLDAITYNGWLEIQHTYRAKNEFGGIVTRSEWFQVDNTITKVNCCFRGQHN